MQDDATPAPPPWNDERWRSFAAFAAHMLTKPSFDREEREARLGLAQALAQALAAVSSDPASTGRLAHVLTTARYRITDTGSAAHAQWMAGWLDSDHAELRAALALFADPARGELERFAAFVRAYDRAAQAERVPALETAASVMGSLFNFAVEPARLPLVLERPFRAFEELLGVESVPDETLTERYRRRLELTRAVERGLQDAGVAVRDMLDVQSLILLGARNPGFWASASGAATEDAPHRAEPPDVYLSVCAIYRDEAPYLREWIEFHRLVGVERFFMYDNLSTDDHAAVLAPYVESGIVVLHDWPLTERAQLPAYDDCVRRHRDESRWIAFIDIDEFLFSPGGQPLPEVLPDYERWPAVGVNWAVFGPSGHERRPPGLVIESYDQRLRVEAKTIATTTIKSIVDPARVVSAAGVHAFTYERLGTVDENHYPIWGGRTKSPSIERLRVNHYLTKSLEEFQRLGTRVGQNPGSSVRRFELATREAWDHDSERDDAIMRYLPELRRALGRKPGP
jgi:glycosyl transferase family 92